MKTKVEPKLKFEVGEEVVVCGAHHSWTGNEYWPNEDNFTFTTVKEVCADGSVVVEEGYRFRQAYRTYFGELEVFDYFRVSRVKDDSSFKFKCKNYTHTGFKLARVLDNCSFWGPVYLYKKTKEFDDKVKVFEEENKQYLKEEEARTAKRTKEKSFRDAYNAELEPLEKQYQKTMALLWRKHFCANCKHNCGGYCTQWKKEHKEDEVSCCSAWEVE